MDATLSFVTFMDVHPLHDGMILKDTLPCDEIQRAAISLAGLT